MKVLSAVVLATSLGCAARGATITAGLPTETDFVPYAMQLAGLVSLSSACPIKKDVYTASHVVLPWMEAATFQELGYSWSTPSGLRGYLNPLSTGTHRDLSTMELAMSNDLPKFWKAAAALPSEGDRVRWVEYDESPEAQLAPVQREAHVLRTIGGYVQFDVEPAAGSSGGCLWNDSDEVVGVVVWGWGNTGLAVLTAGYWFYGE